MTAPALAPAPAQAPTAAAPAPAVVETQPVVAAPVVETEKKPESMQSIMDRITRKVTPEAVAEPAEIVAVPDEQAAALAAKAGDSPAEAVAQSLEPAPSSNLVQEIKADEPEGEVMLRARDPKTGQFSDMDQSRTYELSIRDKQTGETRLYNKTLPELMRMAKDGIATQKSRAELDHHRTRAPQIVAENQQLTSKVQQLETLTHQLLTADEPWVVQQRESYAKQFTPEARVKQLEAQLQQVQQARTPPAPQQQPQQMPPEVARQIQDFGAAVAPITQEVESLVGVDAARGRLIGAVTPIMVNNQIPPERLAEVQQYIQGPYREWAKAEAAKQNAAKQELDAARQERLRAQQTARSVGTATRPAGGSSSLAPAPTPKPRTVQDAITKAINRPVASAPS